MKPLPGGGCIVSIRHDGAKEVAITGDDPQQVVENQALSYTGPWQAAPRAEIEPQSPEGA